MSPHLRIGFAAALALAATAMTATAVAATTYRWVDDQGVVHYSDTPHPGAQELHLSGAQTYHDTPPSESPYTPYQPGPSSEPTDSAGSNPYGYQSCAITQPPPNTDLFAPDSVSVSVDLNPALHPGDRLQVMVDGVALQAPGNSLSFQLQAPDRGTHTISAQVRNPQGTVLCNAAPITFSVQRPSVNSPVSPVKPH